MSKIWIVFSHFYGAGLLERDGRWDKRGWHNVKESLLTLSALKSVLRIPVLMLWPLALTI